MVALDHLVEHPLILLLRYPPSLQVLEVEIPSLNRQARNQCPELPLTILLLLVQVMVFSTGPSSLDPVLRAPSLNPSALRCRRLLRTDTRSISRPTRELRVLARCQHHLLRRSLPHNHLSLLGGNRMLSKNVS
jgi:hypothetical protein